jgi:RNA polymerase sigma-70 factor (ECF subfamily)
MDQNDDKKLISDFLKGDESALSKLINKYLKPIYNFIYRFLNDAPTTDDLVQATFMKTWKNLKKFDRSKSFKTWIFTIARNTVYDYLRKKKTIPFSKFTDEEGNNKLENISEDELLPDEILIKKDIAKEVEEKLNDMPDLYRTILIMHYKDDFSLTEIAEVLNIPYNTVKSRYIRALKRLKKALLENQKS